MKGDFDEFVDFWFSRVVSFATFASNSAMRASADFSSASNSAMRWSRGPTAWGTSILDRTLDRLSIS